jgi:hypothetical protein
LDADAGGDFSGEIAFDNNDSDEDPFNFQVNGHVTAVQIIDDTEGGFAITGSWSTHSQPPGAMNGTFHYSAAGSGFDVATWTFDVTAGVYRVSASWSASYNRATDAKYSVLDDATSLATVTVNQQIAADDLADAGVLWEDLGTFAVSSTTLVVELADNANNFVIADAIRIEKMSGGESGVQSFVGGGSAAASDVDDPLDSIWFGTPPRVFADGVPGGDWSVETVRQARLDVPWGPVMRQRFDQPQRDRDRIWAEDEDWLRVDIDFLTLPRNLADDPAS